MIVRRAPPLLLSALVCAAAAAQAGERPTIVRLDPTHLAAGVDPATTSKLVITFDRDMDRTVHGLCGGGPGFPTVSSPRWLDARTFVIDAKLAADRVYAMDIACPGSAGFRAANGASLRPQPWRVATRGETLAAGAAAAATLRLFVAIRDHYSYRDRLGVDWDELARTRHDALLAAADGPALALLFAELLGAAQDPHVSVRWQDCLLPTYRRDAVGNFDVRGLRKAFPKLDRVGRIGLAARTHDGIGYLLVSSFAREQKDDFELALQALRALCNCQALVLDVRTNGGGDENLAKRLAAFFVEGDKVYAAHRVRDPAANDGWRNREQRTVRGNREPDVFAGPVAVLMGPLNLSSCEAFLLMMKQARRATLIGADSGGSSGNPQPHSPLAGLTVMLPSWQAMRPDGTVFEGEGIAPHTHVATTPDALAAGDPVLAEALQRLRDTK